MCFYYQSAQNSTKTNDIHFPEHQWEKSVVFIRISVQYLTQFPRQLFHKPDESNRTILCNVNLFVSRAQWRRRPSRQNSWGHSKKSCILPLRLLHVRVQVFIATKYYHFTCYHMFNLFSMAVNCFNIILLWTLPSTGLLLQHFEGDQVERSVPRSQSWVLDLDTQCVALQYY